METIKLNLARKWRSQNFDQIIGQDLSVRILKNSLYLGHYFPVYLFAGQRGCGKTTTARLFAAALNCEQLSTFQKNPKKASVPCLQCSSCVAMQSGKHPDFIEIDAASHTGVDNIRQIIESSSLLPLMGHKKVYLIDEAHMLSKAAFNALLKILEEPPASALFILATTNPLKIIDTVRSRCFQLFFSPVEFEPLLQHLKHICANEKIEYQDAALELIIKHTQGSVRDALNLLEQVRFSSTVLSQDAVLRVLGHLDDDKLMQVIKAVLLSSQQDLLQLLQSLNVDKYSAEFMWRRITELLRALLWLKHGVDPVQFVSVRDNLRDCARLCSLQQLHDMLEMFFTNETIMLNTTIQHALLEMVLLQVCQRNKKRSGGGGPTPAAQQQASVVSQKDEKENLTNDDDEFEQQQEHEEDDDEETESVEYMEQWASFVARLEQLNDPLVLSIFKQARFLNIDEITHQITIEFAKELVFFQEWLTDTKQLWLPVLQEAFSKQSNLHPQFTGAKTGDTKIKPAKISSQATQQVMRAKPQPAPQQKNSNYTPRKWNKSTTTMPQFAEAKVDVSDKTVWKKANLLLHYFPGTVTKIRK